MSYAETLERLKQLEDGPRGELTEPTKAPSVSFVSAQPGTSPKNQASVGSDRCQSKALSRPPTGSGEKSQRLRVEAAKTDKRVVPLVRCRDCQHFEPDCVNPPAGLGRCRIDAAGNRLPWPRLNRRCDHFEITGIALFRECRRACSGLMVDPSELADFIDRQKDPDLHNPAAIRRWAELIHKLGRFPG